MTSEISTDTAPICEQAIDPAMLHRVRVFFISMPEHVARANIAVTVSPAPETSETLIGYPGL